MKKIRDEISLSNKLEAISMMELRSSPGEVLSSVELGKTFLITRNGRTIAVLSKVPGKELAINYDKKGCKSYTL